jgi:hypothetical protein
MIKYSAAIYAFYAAIMFCCSIQRQVSELVQLQIWYSAWKTRGFYFLRVKYVLALGLSKLFNLFIALFLYYGCSWLWEPFRRLPFSLFMLYGFPTTLCYIDFVYDIWLFSSRFELEHVIRTCCLFAATVKGGHAAKRAINAMGRGWSRVMFVFLGQGGRRYALAPNYLIVQLTEDVLTQVPHHFRCGVCLGFLDVPLVTPSGQSFCKACIDSILYKKRTKWRDPGNTKQPLYGLSVYYNRNLQQASEDWLEQHHIPYRKLSEESYMLEKDQEALQFHEDKRRAEAEAEQEKREREQQPEAT